MARTYEDIQRDIMDKKKELARERKLARAGSHPECIHELTYLGDAIRDGKFSHEINYCKKCSTFVNGGRGAGASGEIYQLEVQGRDISSELAIGC